MENWTPTSKISDSSITGVVFINDLRNAGILTEIEKKFKIVNIEATYISEGKGYLSKVYRCDVTFASLPGVTETPPKLSVALKQPSVKVMDAALIPDNENTEQNESKKHAIDHFHEMIKKFHNHECTFYNIFSDTDLPMPKLYGSCEWTSEKEGYLLFEFVQNGRFMGLENGFTTGEAKSLINFVAKLQAIGFQRKKLWINKFEKPNFGNSSDNFMGEAYMEKVARGCSDEFKQLHRRFTKFYTDQSTASFLAGDKWIELNLPTALVHGDMWSNNLNFKTGENSDEINAIIDWQVVHDGNPLLDVSRVLSLCCDADVRRQLEPTVTQYLYAKVTEYLGHAPPYSIDNLNESKRYADLFSLFFAMFMPAVHYIKNDAETQLKKANF